MTDAQLEAALAALALDYTRGLLTAADLRSETIEAVTRWLNDAPST